MKRQNMPIKSLFSILLFSVFLLFASCAKNVRFMNSAIVPAAQGSVKVKKDPNNNYSVTVNVAHLADPSRLSPPKRVYVVWMNTSEKSVINIGALKVKSGFFSSTREGQLITSTPFKAERIFITAEDEPNGERPGGVVVMDTSDF